MQLARENLKQKVAILLKDIEKFTEADQKTTVTEFILNELKLMEREQTWTARDLHQIKSMAQSIAQNLSTDTELGGKRILSDGRLTERYCLVVATIRFLRGKGMLPYNVGIQDLKPKCAHSDVRPVFLADGKAEPELVWFQCAGCGAEVKPVGWSAKS